MGRYVLRRSGQMLVTLVLVSILGFVIIQLPPGDYLTLLQAQMQDQRMTPEQIEAALATLQGAYGLDKPIYVQYWLWISNLLRGNLGYSLALGREVGTLLNERLALTVAISLVSIAFSLSLALPIGVLSAVKQYSWSDYLFTLLAFLGVAVPDMLLALVLMFVAVVFLGASSIGGLFSAEYITAPWSIAKVIDLAKHIWLPIIIVGLSSTAGTIRVVRARMLDTLGEPFIQTARMKGLDESRIITRHALRVVLNPVVSGLGMSLPGIISGETITALVIGLPTVGPLMLTALFAEDLYMAGSILVILTAGLVVGNFLADLGLAWLDPRIRLVD
ncbi:MAG: ABC transporter permease [Planctomycetes bacterium]|nr:ABC transporter permease [Planctomycetota bacterium]